MSDSELNIVEFDKAKELMINEEQLKSIMATEVEQTSKMLQSLDKDFVDKLTKKVFDFRDITAKDVIDIVYEDRSKLYISTGEICKVVGVELDDKLSSNDHKGTIKLCDDGLKIQYNKNLESIERRFIRAHELGHLFKHLILGLEMEFRDKETSLLREARETVEEKDVIAAFSKTDNSLTDKQKKYEKEATHFALEIIFSEDLMSAIIESKEKNLSAGSIQDFCRISKENLKSRLSNKNISIDDSENQYGINITSNI